ncbi:HRDC domain-containing protein, partial [Streptomyces noursei]
SGSAICGWANPPPNSPAARPSASNSPGVLRGGVERGGSAPAAPGRPRRTHRSPARCRVCNRTLTDPGEMKLMRCEECPSELDEALYDRLRDWRAGQAARTRQPAYCIFTDKTLMAIAEVVPTAAEELAVIPGVGRRKLDRFGADVLAICAGEEPGGAVAEGSEDGAENSSEK